MISQRVKNELSVIAGVAALFALAARKPKTSAALAAAGAGLWLWPKISPGFLYAGKSVVITGGSRGLGLALAYRLVKEGAHITLLARDKEELERAKEKLVSEGARGVQTIVCDMTVEEDVKAAIASVLKTFKRIDVWINDAGAISVGPFESMTMDDFKAQMDLHLYAVIRSTQLLIPEFRKLGEGRMINISSIGGKFPHPHMSPYATSKFALSGFSKVVAAELASENIFITTVYPGLMRTGSYIQAVFKGDHEKEFNWFATSDLLPGLSMSADRAASRILNAAKDGNSELVLSIPAKIGSLFYSLFPGITDYLLSAYANTLPKGQSKTYKTGAESQSEFNRHIWNAPLRGEGDRSRERFNQEEKTNAAFNMGLIESKEIH